MANQKLTRESLVEVVFETCGAYKKGDITYGRNLTPNDGGFDYLVANGVVKETKAKEEKVTSAVNLGSSDLAEKVRELEKSLAEAQATIDNLNDTVSDRDKTIDEQNTKITELEAKVPAE